CVVLFFIEIVSMMMRSLIACLMAGLPCMAQNDTLYFKNNDTLGRFCSETVYRVLAPNPDGRITFRDYDEQHRLRIIGNANTPSASIREGDFTSYDTSGLIQEKGFFHRGFRRGEWNYYFVGTQRKKQVIIYDSVSRGGYIRQYDSICATISAEGFLDANEHKTGIWKEYYPCTTQLHWQRNYVAHQRTGEQQEFYKNGRCKRQENWTRGRIQQGRMYDSSGKKISYFPQVIYPRYPKNLYKNLKKIRRNSKDVQSISPFIVQLQIRKDGTVGQIKWPDTNLEGIDKNYIEYMLRTHKRWKPYQYEHKPYDHWFALRIW
ncbi:MAG TPA: hypothetical protein PLU10_02770, partial [Chitinophagaceae bacterium]|nr:hypothetical protein [Chitinophagaceae bacterium]